MDGISMADFPGKGPSGRKVSLLVPEALCERLDALAKSTERTRDMVALEALSTYLDSQDWQVNDIAAGLQEADRGDFAGDAELSAVFTKHGA